MSDAKCKGAFPVVTIPQGKEAGQLFYDFSPTGVATKPSRFIRGPGGNFYFLEAAPAPKPPYGYQRLQKFSAAGELLSGVDLEPLGKALGAGKTVATLSIDDLFLDPDGRVRVVARALGANCKMLGAGVATFAGDGKMLASHALGREYDQIQQIEFSAIDGHGTLWIKDENATYIFDPDGRLHLRHDNLGSYVDSDGFAYRRTRVYDRSGAEVAKLKVSGAGFGTLRIDGADAEGLAFTWMTGLSYERTAATSRSQNRIAVFEIDKKTWALKVLGDIGLPDTRVRFPDPRFSDPNDERVVHEEYYDQDLCFMHDGHLYVLANSDTEYWVLDLDVRDYLARTAYLGQYDDLGRKTPAELRLMRNEIFARHGRAFDSDDLRDHFAKQDWYESDPGFSDARLFPDEWRMVDRLRNLEKTRK